MTDQTTHTTRRRATMRQVAREAGVSVMTVSYAFSHPDRVSAEARERVRSAAQRLRYPGPHPGARSLRRGRTGTLGVVLGEPLPYAFDDPQATDFLAGVASLCVERGLGLTLIPVSGEAADVERVQEAAVDAFVVWTTVDADPILDAISSSGAAAAVHGGPRREDMALVAIDDRRAARAAGQAAWTGARRAAVLSFPLDRTRRSAIRSGLDPASASFAVTRRRLEGFRDAWVDSGGDWSLVPVALAGRNDDREAEALAARLLRAPHPPDAIAAMSDELALGVRRAADAIGVEIPAELSLTGWDDGPGAAAAGLTTVAQSLREQGKLCARLAMDESVSARSPGWELVLRRSTR